MTPDQLHARALEAARDACDDSYGDVDKVIAAYESALWCDDMDAAPVGRYVITEDNKGGICPGCFINDGTFWHVGRNPAGKRSDFKRWRYPPDAPGSDKIDSMAPQPPQEGR